MQFDSAMISAAFPLITVGPWLSTRSLHVRVRREVAPQPTGSSTQGFASWWALAAAFCMDATQGVDSVPMLIDNADASATNSSTSSSAEKNKNAGIIGNVGMARRDVSGQMFRREKKQPTTTKVKTKPRKN